MGRVRAEAWRSAWREGVPDSEPPPDTHRSEYEAGGNCRCGIPLDRPRKIFLECSWDSFSGTERIRRNETRGAYEDAVLRGWTPDAVKRGWHPDVKVGWKP